MLNALDETDIQILEILQDNARLSNAQVGDKVSKSQASVNARLKRLHDEGFILRYVALLDRAKIERNVMAITNIKLNDHSRKALRHFENQINKLPEVQECLHVTGEYDFMLKVIVKDIAAYQQFLENTVFENVPMASVQSSIVLKQTKMSTAVAISNTKSKG
jgi:Lrp/AsnC family leucine-responsive transcriptional regulator